MFAVYYVRIRVGDLDGTSIEAPLTRSTDGRGTTGNVISPRLIDTIPSVQPVWKVSMLVDLDFPPMQQIPDYPDKIPGEPQRIPDYLPDHFGQFIDAAMRVGAEPEKFPVISRLYGNLTLAAPAESGLRGERA